MGIDAYINPRSTTVSSILRHVRHGRIRAVYTIGDAEAELIEAQVLGTSSLAGKTLRDIDWPEGVLVGAVMKGNEINIAKSNTVLDEGDIITVFYNSKVVNKVEKMLEVLYQLLSLSLSLSLSLFFFLVLIIQFYRFDIISITIKISFLNVGYENGRKKRKPSRFFS